MTVPDTNTNHQSTPGFGADAPDEIARFIPEDIRAKFEVHSYRHAAAILANSAPKELDEILTALRAFRLQREWLITGGGNESAIPKAVSQLLRPHGWYETRIHGDLLVTLEVHQDDGQTKTKEIRREVITRPDFLDGHKVDYVKNRVAFDLEWNSKDQTFDRDLYAARAFYECGLISAGVLLTRSGDLNELFDELKIKSKYGASTT